MEKMLGMEHWYLVARAVVTLLFGLLAAQLARSALGRTLAGRTTPQHAMVAKRVVYYAILTLAFVSALRELGLDLSVLLGAAGIVTVAFGFASQTSASNLISGLFLIGEQPFVVGEVIRVGDATGEVISIDLLSVKLRTFDNLYVRVPNETLVKAQITNFSRFPIRRYDLHIGVAYKEQIGKVREILMGVAEENMLCLQEPKPQIIFQSFGDSSVNLQFSVWAARENYLALRNSMAEKVKAALEKAAIEIPFPHRSLYTGSTTEPFPVTLVPVEPPAASAGPSEAPPAGSEG